MGKDRNMKAIVFAPSIARYLLCKAVGRLFPSVHVGSLGCVRLVELRRPGLPGDDWVLCRTRLGGICGTDIGMIFLRQHPASMLECFVSFPIMLGHENVAEVVSVGSLAEEFVRPGQRIVVDPPFGCVVRKIRPLCLSCKRGEPSICINFDKGQVPPALGLGYSNFAGGSWSEYFLAHISQVHLLPDTIRDEDAILIDPLACSLHVLLNSGIRSGEKILILGAGIIGLGVLMLLRSFHIKADITITVRYEFQRRLAETYGADHTVMWGKDKDKAFKKLADITGTELLKSSMGLRFLRCGYDVVIDCSGSVGSFNDATRVIRPFGRYIVAGTPQLGLVDMSAVWFRQIKLMGLTGRGTCSPDSGHSYERIISMINDGRLDLSRLPRRFYRQEDYKRAILQTRDKRNFPYVKTAFDFR